MFITKLRKLYQIGRFSLWEADSQRHGAIGGIHGGVVVEHVHRYLVPGAHGGGAKHEPNLPKTHHIISQTYHRTHHRTHHRTRHVRPAQPIITTVDSCVTSMTLALGSTTTVNGNPLSLLISCSHALYLSVSVKGMEFSQLDILMRSLCSHKK